MVAFTSSLSVVCSSASLFFSATSQLLVPTGSQAPADRSLNGHLTGALDDEPQG